jgi:hypothetical protein
VEPDLFLVYPAGGAKIVADELALRRRDVARLRLALGIQDAGDPHVPGVRIAGQGHGFVLEEQLKARVRLVGRGAVDALEISNAEDPEISLPHLAAGRRVESVQHGGMLDLLPAGHHAPAHESDGFACACPIGDRCLLAAAILSRQFQRLR